MIKDATTIGKTTLQNQNPHQTGAVVKQLAHQNIAQVSHTTMGSTLDRALPVQHRTAIVNKPSLLVTSPSGKPDLLRAIRASAPKINSTLNFQPPSILNLSNLPHKIESTLALKLPEIHKPSLIPTKPNTIVKPATSTLGTADMVSSVAIPIKSTISLPANKLPQPAPDKIDAAIAAATLAPPAVNTTSTLVVAQPQNAIIVQPKQDFWQWFMQWLATL